MHGYGALPAGTSDLRLRTAVCAALSAVLALSGCATITVMEAPLVASDAQSKQRAALQRQAEHAVETAVAAGWAETPSTLSFADILLNGMEANADGRDALIRYLDEKPAERPAALAAVRADIVAARLTAADLAESVEGLLAREGAKLKTPGGELTALERTLIVFKRGATLFSAAQARLQADEARSGQLELELLESELERLTIGVDRLAGRRAEGVGS